MGDSGKGRKGRLDLGREIADLGHGIVDLPHVAHKGLDLSYLDGAVKGQEAADDSYHADYKIGGHGYQRRDKGGHKLRFKGIVPQLLIYRLKVKDGLFLLVEKLDFLVSGIHFRDGSI